MRLLRLRRAMGRRVNLTTSHPSMIASLSRSRSWKCVGIPQDRFPGARDCGKRGAGSDGRSAGRAVASFEYR